MVTADEDGYFIVIRCKRNSLSLSYVTPEVVREPLMLAFTPTSYIKVRADGGKVYKFQGEVGLFGTAATFGLTTSIPPNLVLDLGNASSRVSAVVEMKDRNMHEHRFSIAGLRQAVDALTKKCSYFEGPNSREEYHGDKLQDRIQ